LKKPIGSVRFYKPETKKTEPRSKKIKPNRKKKQSQTGLNRFFSKKSNRTETGWFEPVLVFLKKLVWLLF
jgi:hypothetical protein